MSTIEDLTASLHTALDTRVRDALANIRRSYENEPDMTRLLVTRWDLFERMCMPVGGLAFLTPRLYNLNGLYGFLDVLEWISFFVCHEICDDGEPNLIWYRRERVAGARVTAPRPATPDEPKAYALLLRSDYNDTEGGEAYPYTKGRNLFVTAALLEREVDKIQARFDFAHQHRPDLGYKPSALQRDLTAIFNELFPEGGGRR